MLTLKSLFSEYLKLLEDNSGKIEVCQEALDWVKKTLLNSEITFGEAMSEYVANSELPSSWGTYAILSYKDAFDSEVRSAFISKIKDPIEAMTFMKFCEDLTESEITQLKAIYEGKVTTEKTDVIVKYVSAECTGKGFIIPTDSVNMKFEALTPTLWKVEGATESIIDAWISRVSGTSLVKATTTAVGDVK